MDRRAKPRRGPRTAATTRHPVASRAKRGRRRRAPTPGELLESIARTIEGVANTALPLAEATATLVDPNEMDRRRDRMRRALSELEAAMTDAAELAREARLAMDAVHERDLKNRPIRHK